MVDSLAWRSGKSQTRSVGPLFELSLDCAGAGAVTETVAEAVAEPVVLCLQLVAVAPPPLPPAGAALARGFTLLPPFAFAKSHENVAWLLCCRIATDWSFEFFGPLDD
jgi:hypothetical protein